MSINNVILLGNVGRDSELRHMPSGAPVLEFSLATSDYYMSKDGKKVDKVEWHRVLMYGNRTEKLKDFIKKGLKIYVEGSIRNEEYKNKHGENVRATKIIAKRIEFVSGSGKATDGVINSSTGPSDDGVVYDESNEDF